MNRTDMVMAALALLAFTVFLGVLVWKVPSPALVIVCIVGVGFAFFDFINTALRGRAPDQPNRSRLP